MAASMDNKISDDRRNREGPSERASAGPCRRGDMTDLEVKIIKKILEDENAMKLALDFILQDQEILQEHSADLRAS